MFKQTNKGRPNSVNSRVARGYFGLEERHNNRHFDTICLIG
jgi:hypothetical protein